MEFLPGSQLGPYQIIGRLGAGGMGEVFRARDPRLERSVAIKVLAPQLASDPSFRSRLEREAKTISQLNHPNICTLYDIGVDDGRAFLVMELIEGETLADRLARGALPLADVLRYGAQIADALERAHRAGIVHRDLKPGNVMITKSGVKLLDFGLARNTVSEISKPDAPTEQQPLSDAGMIVGTLPYMSPEQLQGGVLDHRVDLFALGAVLYEMTAGVRAFAAENAASLIAKILEHDTPTLESRGTLTPPLLEHVISTCLQKDRDLRFQSAADVAHELRWLERNRTAVTTQPESGSTRSVWLWPSIAALAVTAAGVAGYFAWRHADRPSPFAAATFRQMTFDSGDEREPVISPDGKLFAFVKLVDGQRDIFLQRIDGRSAINLTNEKQFDDSEPSFSPDGSQIAFRSERDGGGIFLMGATGESVRRLTDKGYNPSWSPEGQQIIFAEQRLSSPNYVFGIRNFHVVDIASGSVRRFYDGLDILQPRWSPHGRRVAFWSPTQGTRDLLTIDRKGTAASVVNVTNDRATDWSPFWSADGRHLYFSSDRSGTMNLWRIAIDEETGRAGELEALQVPSRYAGYPTISSDGTRVLHQSDSVRHDVYRINVDADSGTVTPSEDPVLSGSMFVSYATASPDRKLIAFMGAAPEEDVYVVSADGTGLRQLTSDKARDRGMVWTPDGSRILFYSNRTGKYQAHSIRPDGSGLQKLTDHQEGVNFPRISPDGRRISYVPGKGSAEVAMLRPDGTAARGELLPDTPRGRLVPRTWSASGRLLAGAPYGGRGLFVYDFATRRLTDLGIESLASAFIDDGRIFFFDSSHRFGVIDVTTRATRYIGSLPVSPRLNGEWSDVYTDGRTVLAVRTQRESDVWLMEMPRASQQ
ncbi:MAG TPA: protein kinase [Thermoanaerobaculia bacterium]|nr:protein kinase [Thermoanaerobaculia bacterium]